MKSEAAASPIKSGSFLWDSPIMQFRQLGAN